MHGILPSKRRSLHSHRYCLMLSLFASALHFMQYSEVVKREGRRSEIERRICSNKKSSYLGASQSLYK